MCGAADSYAAFIFPLDVATSIQAIPYVYCLSSCLSYPDNVLPKRHHDVYRQWQASTVTSSCLAIIDVAYSDILSFYKEELAGESVNRISTLASQHKESKQKALDRLVSETVVTYQNILEVLKTDGGASEAFSRFVEGYIGFHVALDSRYHLSDLNI